MIPGSIVEIGDRWTSVDDGEIAFRGVISIDNARTQLGWSPRFELLEDGVAEYISRFRAFIAAGGSPTQRPPIKNAPGS
jgi:nucleoside-diphosphate-sugar epimerase